MVGRRMTLFIVGINTVLSRSQAICPCLEDSNLAATAMIIVMLSLPRGSTLVSRWTSPSPDNSPSSLWRSTFRAPWRCQCPGCPSGWTTRRWVSWYLRQVDPKQLSASHIAMGKFLLKVSKVVVPWWLGHLSSFNRRKHYNTKRSVSPLF